MGPTAGRAVVTHKGCGQGTRLLCTIVSRYHGFMWGGVSPELPCSGKWELVEALGWLVSLTARRAVAQLSGWWGRDQVIGCRLSITVSQGAKDCLLALRRATYERDKERA